MKLQMIDKTLYRKRLNILLFLSITILLITSLAISNTLIHFLGTDVKGDNFWLNFIGVATGGGIVFILFKMIESKPVMAEINYVRSLKKEMNRIYRSSKKIQAALEVDNKNAIIISYFNLKASKQVYELDNNTLTMDELNEKIRLLDAKIEALGLSISEKDYSPSLLKQIDTV